MIPQKRNGENYFSSFCSGQTKIVFILFVFYQGIKPWVYGASVGGVGLIISIILAVLKIFFGAFACCTNTNKNDNIELEQVNSNVNNADTNIFSNPNV